MMSMILPLVVGNVPSGGVLASVSVLVVFLSLAILYVFYSLIGSWFKRNPELRKKKRKSKRAKDEVAIAIALALEQEMGSETYAAIATALHLYLDDTVHDNESYVLTIKQPVGAWGTKGQTFRQVPNKK